MCMRIYTILYISIQMNRPCGLANGLYSRSLGRQNAWPFIYIYISTHALYNIGTLNISLRFFSVREISIWNSAQWHSFHPTSSCVWVRIITGVWVIDCIGVPDSFFSCDWYTIQLSMMSEYIYIYIYILTHHFTHELHSWKLVRWANVRRVNPIPLAFFALIFFKLSNRDCATLSFPCVGWVLAHGTNLRSSEFSWIEAA